MIQNKKKKQHNGFSEFISKVILPCTTDLGESSKRILEKHRKRTICSNLQLNQASGGVQSQARTQGRAMGAIVPPNSESCAQILLVTKDLI